MGKITLITGGARSGKSSYALKTASAHEGRRAFVATLTPLDDEMEKRIELHRIERGTGWDTFEEPVRLSALFSRLEKDYDVLIVDCLTLWLSNVMLAGMDIKRTSDELVKALERARKSMRLFVVTNEVGLGIVPDNSMARAFRDHAGTLNQKVAEISDEVYLMTAGLPLKLKTE
jgi:adenosylcobinamide kinase/adenosylcobinamide-phosphate guanylyltransferase